MNEEYNSMADKLRDEFNSTLSSSPTSLFSEEELEALASDSDIAKKSQMLGSKFESFRDEMHISVYWDTQVGIIGTPR